MPNIPYVDTLSKTVGLLVGIVTIISLIAASRGGFTLLFSANNQTIQHLLSFRILRHFAGGMVRQEKLLELGLPELKEELYK
jgi:hypothetical protein